MATITINNVKADSPYVKAMAESLFRAYTAEYERVLEESIDAMAEMKVGETRTFSTRPFEITVTKDKEDEEEKND